MRTFFYLIFSSFLIIVQNVSAQELLIIVNPKRNIDSLTLERAKKIILSKEKKWKDGSSIKVFLPNENVFPVIIQELFEMDEFKWEEYWGKYILESGGKPPQILSNELSIIKSISKNKKAIGVITKEKYNDTLKSMVKVVLKVDGQK